MSKPLMPVVFVWQGSDEHGEHGTLAFEFVEFPVVLRECGPDFELLELLELPEVLDRVLFELLELSELELDLFKRLVMSLSVASVVVGSLMMSLQRASNRCNTAK